MNIHVYHSETTGHMVCQFIDKINSPHDIGFLLFFYYMFVCEKEIDIDMLSLSLESTSLNLNYTSQIYSLWVL